MPYCQLKKVRLQRINPKKCLSQFQTPPPVMFGMWHCWYLSSGSLQDRSGLLEVQDIITWRAGACLGLSLATNLNHNRAVGAGRFSGIVPQPSLASKPAAKLCWRAAVLEVLWWQQIRIGAEVSACTCVCAEPCACTRKCHVNKYVLFLQSNGSFLETQISLHLRGNTGSATAKLYFEWDLNPPQ